MTLRTILRPLTGLAALNAVAGFLWGGVSVVTVILAVDQLGAGEAATGYLNAAIGVGGVVGALMSGAIVLRPNMAPALFAGAAILGIGFFLLGIAGSLLVGIIAMAITAAGAIVAEVVGTTVFQRVVPDAIRGRTLGAMQTVETVTYASGAFLMPLLVVNVGAAIVLPVGGAAIVATSLVTLALVGPNLRRAPDAASELLLRVSRLPLFTGVPPDALERAAGRLQALAVTAGTSVIREGEPADRFYLIESGKFAVDQLDPGTRLPRRLRVMGPDEIFGELGLMHNAPRSASVTAETDGRLLWLDGPDFLELLNTGPEISGRMLDRYRATAAPPS